MDCATVRQASSCASRDDDADAWPSGGARDTVLRTSYLTRMLSTAPRAPTIVVAEDNADQRSLYVTLLSSAGYRVFEAADGAEAVDVVRREQPGLVLMDVTMPGTSGWNAVRILKEDIATREIPIIVVTGLASAWDRDASIAAGCDEYLAKPVPPARLLEEVRKFLPP